MQEGKWTFNHWGFYLLRRSLCLVTPITLLILHFLSIYFFSLIYQLKILTWIVNPTGIGWIVWMQEEKTVLTFSGGMPKKANLFSSVILFFNGAMEESILDMTAHIQRVLQYNIYSFRIRTHDVIEFKPIKLNLRIRIVSYVMMWLNPNQLC